MIFEGTKNKFFFGLGLTRAGHAIPDVNMLVPLAEQLGVSVTELLQCRQQEESESMDRAAADNLVKKVIEISEEQNPQNKKKNKMIYFVLLAISVIEALGFYALESVGLVPHEGFLFSVFLVVPLAIIFGAYFWIFVKEKLPSYYDENKINVYVDGMLHMNLPGVYFNNNNWPYIIKSFRIWSVIGMVGYPGICLIISRVAEIKQQLLL